MDGTDYLIANCKAEDFEYACPKLWGELDPSFSATVRHCDHCNRKVYLCRTDADIEFYSSVNFCIAVADIHSEAEQFKRLRKENLKKTETEYKSGPEARIMGIDVNMARRAAREINKDDIPAFLRKSADNCET